MMDYRELTNLLFKIAGAVIITYTIVQAPAYISYYVSSGDNSIWVAVGAVLLPMLIPLVLGLLFLLFPRAVTNRLIEGSELQSKNTLDVHAVESIAFSTLGLYLLFRVVSDLVYHGTTVFVVLRSREKLGYDIEHVLPYELIIATIAELVFALYLFVGAGGLVRLLARLRTAACG